MKINVDKSFYLLLGESLFSIFYLLLGVKRAEEESKLTVGSLHSPEENDKSFYLLRKKQWGVTIYLQIKNWGVKSFCDAGFIKPVHDIGEVTKQLFIE